MKKEKLYEGPDLSEHNGYVDIKRVRDAGCKRVGIRAGYGKNNIDQRYVPNAQACYNLGVDVLYSLADPRMKSMFTVKKGPKKGREAA